MDNFQEVNLTKVEQVTFFDEHYYRLNTPEGEEFLPSVTTILQVSPKPFLNRWRGDLGNEEADRVKAEGAARGSNIHLACDFINRGGTAVLMQGKRQRYTNDDIEKMRAEHNGLVAFIWDQYEFLQIYRYVKFLEAVNPTSIESEHTVFSLKHKFAGTLDSKMMLKSGKYDINGTKPLELEAGRYIADVKSANYITNDNYLQLAAYWVADEETNKEQIDGALILHTNSTTKKGIEGFSAKLITRPEMEDYFDQFLKMFAVWKISPSPAHPKVFTMPNQLTYKLTA